jgi:lipopolysaccharide biosynthesis glycosyltransferase
MFVASSVRARAAERQETPEIVIVCRPEDIDEDQRRWLNDRAIEVADDFDLASIGGIEIRDARLSPASLVKLLLPVHFAGRYDKILYLDADLGIEHDVTPLFALDTGEFALAAYPTARVWAGWNARDRESAFDHFRDLGMTEPYRYMNTGVMLIDLAKWNGDDLTQKVLAYVHRNGEKCRLIDEDGLNAVLDGRQAELSPVWNLSAATRAHPELREKCAAAIVHFMGLAKPWKRFGDGRRLLELEGAYRAYRRFLAGTPWEGWLRQQWTRRDLRKNVRYHLRDVGARVRRLPTRSSPRQRRLYAEAVLRFWSESRFADVEQGIVVRSGGTLRIAPAAR